MIKQHTQIRIVRNDLKEFLIDGNDFALAVKGLENFGTFENDITVTDNAVGDGGIISSYRLGAIDRTIVCKSLNTMPNSILRSKILSFFNTKQTYKVYVTHEEETRWFEGMVYKFNLPQVKDKTLLTLTVSFMCPNPYFKSFSDFGKDIASVSGGAGFPYLCGITTGFPIGAPTGIFNFAQQVVLENDGDVETYCRAVFVASGDVTNPKLIINGEYVRVIDEMHTGDVIEMDFSANPPTVKKNGVNYIGHCDRTSAFDSMILGIGDTVVEFDADNGTNLLQVSIYYNKLYTAI